MQYTIRLYIILGVSSRGKKGKGKSRRKEKKKFFILIYKLKLINFYCPIM